MMTQKINRNEPCLPASVKIRPFEPSDFSAIEEVYAISKLDELRFEMSSFELLPLKQDTQRLQDLMASRIFVYDDSGIQGYGAVSGSEIRAVFVHPMHRGKGIGKQLLEHLMLHAGNGATLFVAKSNQPAVALYQRYGFEVSREFGTFYNGKPVLANEMVLTVSQG